jgi:2-amino-4-hydroxy-6-hydroxymethyldihydropteridine diphosphokinase
VALAYIGLGSNLGARAANLRAALAAIGRLGRVLRTSRRYRTAPVGYRDQPEFLNQVAELETELTPRALLGGLQRIERELGRVATFRNGPRRIDLDILLYDAVEVHEVDLCIPHPRLCERAFVLRPLAELIDELGGKPMTDWLPAVAGQVAAPLEEGKEDVA